MFVENAGRGGEKSEGQSETTGLLKPPGAGESIRRTPSSEAVQKVQPVIMFCCCFIFYTVFGDFCQTSYLNIYRTELHEICRIGRSLGERSEVMFFDLLWDVVVATNFEGKIDLQSTPCSSRDIR